MDTYEQVNIDEQLKENINVHNEQTSIEYTKNNIELIIKSIISLYSMTCSCHIKDTNRLSELNIINDKYTKLVYKIHQKFKIPMVELENPWKTVKDVITYIQNKL